MITSIFINALGQAIFESCGQALLIYVALQLGMQLFPGITSKYKYDVYYLGLTIITCWFLANLFNIYLHDVTLAKFAILSGDGEVNHHLKYIPTLLQQVEGFITKYAAYIAGLYMIGLMLHAFKLVGGFLNVQHIRKQKNLTADTYWTAKADQLAQKLKVLKKVSLFFSAQVQIPLTIGYIRPLIIFPVALVNNLDTDQVESIILHELAHIKRHDYLLNILQCVMETILCFNPFVWLISNTIRKEREYCCDDMVVDEEYNNFAYSKALFIIAQQNNQNYSLAMASANSNKYPLLNRIKRLNSMNTNQSLPKFHLLVIVAVAAIGGLLAWGIPQYSMAKNVKKRMAQDNIYHSYKFAPAAPLTLHNGKAANGNLTTAGPAKAKISIIISNDTASADVLNDTSKTRKTKYKIVIEDDNGNKKEYNSLNELSKNDKEEFLKENPSFTTPTLNNADTTNNFKALVDFEASPAWQKEVLAMNASAQKLSREFNKNDPKLNARMLAMNINMQKQFNSPQFKKQMADMRLQAEKMSKQVNSPEWKKQEAELQEQTKQLAEQVNSAGWQKQVADMKEQAEQIKEQLNSPEWQKQVADMKVQAEDMAKQANSAEWKKQVADMKIQAENMSKQFNSPEWKKKVNEMQQRINADVKNKIKAEIDQQRAAKKDSLRSATQQKP